MTTQNVRCGGVRLRVDRVGEGPPLLLINGLGASLEMWAPLRPHLPDRELVSFDLPGAGASSTPCLPMRMRRTAGVVARLLSRLGLERTDVLGYSFGGVVAQELAYRHGALADRLILVATSAGWPSWPPSPLVTWLMMTPARYYDRRLANAIVPIVAGGRTARDPSALRASLDTRLATPPSATGYLQQLYAVTGWTSQPWLPLIAQRTLVLHGERDPIVPVVNARLMARRIPGETLSEIPDAGHMLLFDEAERVGPVINEFLNGAHTCM